MQMDQPLYDDGGVTKWIGVPSLFVGLLAFWIAISTFCQYHLGLDFKYQMRGEAPSPFMAIVVSLGLGLWMSNVFFLRTRYYFDPGKNELLVWHRSIFGRSEKVLSLREAKELYVRRGKIKSGVFFDFGIRFSSGKAHMITRARDPEDLPIGAFAAATGLSVCGWGAVDDARSGQDVPPGV